MSTYIDVVEVEPDGHGDGKRGVQSVVVVVVVVDEGLLTVGVAGERWQSKALEYQREGRTLQFPFLYDI